MMTSNTEYEGRYRGEGYSSLGEAQFNSKYQETTIRKTKAYGTDNFIIKTFDPVKKCKYEIRIY